MKFLKNRIFKLTIALLCLTAILVLFGIYTSQLIYADSIGNQNPRSREVVLFPYEHTDLEAMDSHLKEAFRRPFGLSPDMYVGYIGYDLIENSPKKIMLMENFNLQEDRNEFIKSLASYGTPSLTYSAAPYISFLPSFINQRSFETLFIYAAVLTVFGTMLSFVIYNVFQNSRKKFISYVLPFAVILFCLLPAFIIIVLISSFAAPYALTFKYAPLILVVPFISLIVRSLIARRNNAEKQIEEENYEKI